MINHTLQTFLRVNACVQEEFDQYELEVVEGAVPPELSGTLFRNGNGRFEHQGVPYGHLFDGDGMITRFVFQGGRVTYSNRYVRTREFVREENSGKMLYRSFGTNIPGGWPKNALRMQFKNAANTSVVWHGGHLLALWEGGWPHRIDPHTLETIDRYSYDGVLENRYSWVDRQIMQEMPFSAHPKIDPDSGVMYNFGTLPGTKQRLVLYRVEPDGQASVDRTLPMPELVFTHDFLITATGKRIFCLPPVQFAIWKAFMGLATPVESISAQPDKPMKVLVVDPDGTLKTYESDFFFIFHYANGFEQEDGTLIFDAFAMDDFPGAEVNVALMKGDDSATPQGPLRRFIIHPDQHRVTHERLTDYPGELPSINTAYRGKDYQFAWSVGSHPDSESNLLDGLIKQDVKQRITTYLDLKPDLPGETLFIPRPGGTREDDGWIAYLRFQIDGEKTFLDIRDAESMDIVAKCLLPHNIPPGFHGSWVPQVFGDPHQA